MVRIINSFFHKLRVIFSTILANINKFFLFLARPFANYFVLKISYRYDIPEVTQIKI